MKTEGTYVRCERCGRNEFYSDGAYKPSVGIQVLMDGWERRDGRDLCADCVALYDKMVMEFFNEVWDK